MLKWKYKLIKDYIEGEKGNGCTLISGEDIYTGCICKIEIKCKCGNNFFTTFNSFIYKNKKQCTLCGNKQSINKRKLSFKKVYEEVVKKDIVLLTSEEKFNIYHNANTKLFGRTKEGYLVNFTYGRLIDLNESVTFVGKCNPHTIYNINLWLLINSKNIKLLSTLFERSNKKLVWECMACNEKFEMDWNHMQIGNGCPYCAGVKVGLSNCLATKYPELAKQWHPTKNKNLTPYNVTCNNGKKVWWMCDKGHEWQAVISSRNNGRGCPYCSGRLSSDDYNLLVCNPKLCEEWNYDKNIKLPSEYTPNSNKKVWWKCKDCGYEWEAIINDRNKSYNSINCPECNKSKGEKRINNYCKTNNLVFISQQTFNGLIGLGNGLLSYDFYLPNYNLLIEYQGKQHEKYIKGFHNSKKDFEKQVEHDLRKREYAKNNNIKLLEIWYYDFDNIEKILEKELNKLDVKIGTLLVFI